ncbi:type I asparaginase [Lachnospiraceae bacterium]|uniref:asparaginase n=1 Tax=Laedolimicola sp. TaxID=2981663 RepID=UPI0015AA90C1
MKRILLILTGGTIASVDTDEGLRPGITPEDLRKSLAEITDFCEIEILPLLNVDSTNIQPEHWQMIEKAVEENFDNYDGFVITHGTDTMAYTAAALSYMIQNPHKPIVITGSQKPLVKTITDARKNLRDSFRFACEENVNGVYLVFNGEVILGTRARKVRSKSFNAFDSINYPIAAFVDNDRVVRYVELKGEDKPVSFSQKLAPKVFLLKLVPGIKPDILDYIGDNYDAVIIESYGVGGIPFADERNFLDKLESLTRKNCIVVIATQVMLEGSDVELYEVGFKAMSRYHLLQAYDMTTEALVAKLMWLLGKGYDFDTFQREFYRPVANDLLRGQ